MSSYWFPEILYLTIFFFKSLVKAVTSVFDVLQRREKRVNISTFVFHSIGDIFVLRNNIADLLLMRKKQKKVREY